MPPDTELFRPSTARRVLAPVATEARAASTSPNSRFITVELLTYGSFARMLPGSIR